MNLEKLIFLVLILSSTILDIYGEQVCPECICPVEYNPICGRQQVTKKLRGFSSKCVMDCSNQCRKNKFEYLKDGRCGSGKRKYELFEAGPAKTTKIPRRPSLLFI